jgi:hypothetical protein
MQPAGAGVSAVRRGRAAARSAAEDRRAARGARRVRSRSCALGSEAVAAAGGRAAGGGARRRRLHVRAGVCSCWVELEERTAQRIAIEKVAQAARR